MNLYLELIAKAHEDKNTAIIILGLIIEAAEQVELQSWQNLKKIEAVISDTSLSESKCLSQIKDILK